MDGEQRSALCPHGHHRTRGPMFLGLLSTNKEAAALLFTSDPLCLTQFEIMSSVSPHYITYCSGMLFFQLRFFFSFVY